MLDHDSLSLRSTYGCGDHSCERGVRLTATVGLRGEASEVRVRAPLDPARESWGFGAGDLATAASCVAHRLGHLDLVDQIARELAAHGYHGTAAILRESTGDARVGALAEIRHALPGIVRAAGVAA